MISNIDKAEHIKPELQKLHWLPVKQRTEFKMLSIIFKCIIGEAPEYLQELINIKNPSRNMRGSESLTLVPPKKVRTTKHYGDRAFEHAAPYLWNKLPCELRDETKLDRFKAGLKTHLFKVAFHSTPQKD